MLIVGLMVSLATNGMRRTPTLQGGEGRVVGAAEIYLATGFAAASTTLQTSTNRLGIAVAELVVATCSAPTFIPFLVPSGSLTAAPTADGARWVAGVAYLLLSSMPPRTSATPE